MSKFISSLRGWIGIVSIMAFLNTIQCFIDYQFLKKNLYNQFQDAVNPLMARLFGVWTLLAAVIRITCACDLTNRPLYNVTLVTFLLAFGHFCSEAVYYQTATLDVGLMAPLLVSGVSIVWMIIGYWYVWAVDEEEDEENFKKFKKKSEKKAKKVN